MGEIILFTVFAVCFFILAGNSFGEKRDNGFAITAILIGLLFLLMAGLKLKGGF